MTTDLKTHIQTLAKKYLPDTIAHRRHLHQHPELSFQEKETGLYIARELEKLGITHEHGWGENGVVALIEGQNPSKKTVALRADIDALPILEENDIPYKSKNEGIMHACGHDAHTASLLGAARMLQEVKDELEGTVKLIFQPAEERLPGGASLLIKEGVLENPKPATIVGQHVHPPLEVGKVGFRAGKYMASADELFLTVRGKGGHGALPHTCVDTILLTAHIITALQQIVSRNTNPNLPAVVTLGKINSTGGSTNVIPDEVKLEGTFRTMNEKWRFEAHERMRQLVQGIAVSMGGEAELDIKVGYPVLFNEPALTAKARQFAEEYMGVENVVNLPIRLTAEDFAYYSQEMPACFYRLGTGNAKRGTTSGLHTSTFNIDEAALEWGSGLLAWMAVRQLVDEK